MKYITCFLLILLRFSAHGQFGVLDISFGTGGKVITDIGGFNDVGWSVVTQSDGRIIVGGYGNFTTDSSRFALVRYNNDGTVDNGFGMAGKVRTAFGASTGRILSVALQNDGKILVAGGAESSGNCDFALCRYNSDGTPDTTFGSNGKVTTDLGRPADYIQSIAIQADGKIIAGGASGFWYNYDFALTRYEINGNLDTSFGTGGKIITAVGNYIDDASSVAIQNDGKILIAGQSWNDADTSYSFAILRYNSDGTPDNSFDADGKVITDFVQSDDRTGSVIVQSDGKILACGWSASYTGGDFALIRYNTDGSLDTTFGTGGKVKTAMGANALWRNSAALQNDGKIIVAGFQTTASGNDFSLAAYNSDGSPDNSFGSNGIAITDFGSNDDKALSVVVQGDGKIVASGLTFNGSNFDFAIARYNGSTVGIRENGKTGIAAIYPNPTKGILHIDVKNKTIGTSIAIYDLLGTCVFSKSNLDASTREIDLGNQSKGIYFFEINSGDCRSVSKIILE